MTQTKKLLSELQLGKHKVANRVALAPLTRGRANDDFVPQPMAGVYYAQRTDNNLIISEATGISRQGLGWHHAPGIWSDEQVEAWKPIIEGVHAKGGVFSLQLWHMGRQCHSDVIGTTPVSASEEPMSQPVSALNGEKKPAETPHALTEEEIAAVVKDYAKGAANAIRAGADLVEIHAANGYLVDQFLQSKTNKRTDGYGGSVDNQLRFMREVVDAVTAEVGAERTGIRFSPNGAFGEMGSPEFRELFTKAIEYCKDLVYVHVMDGLGFGFHELGEPFTLKQVREVIGDGKAAIIGNVGYTQETAEEQIAGGHADLIAFGRIYINNPDLVRRFREGLPVNEPAGHEAWWNHAMGAKGYIDWPRYGEAKADDKPLQAAAEAPAAKVEE